jgi:TPR repeat protein
MMLMSKSISSLLVGAALIGTGALLLPSPAAAQSGSPCAAISSTKLSPAAIAMRANLAAVPTREWLAVDNDIFFAVERRAFALGGFDDMCALAQSGDRRAQHLIGRAYSFGQFGAAQNAERAAEWHSRASAAGEARSQVSLGLAYDRGDGVRRDDREALRLYQAAADGGFAWGQFNLGVFYEDGRAVRQDYRRAMALYRQAAAQNHPSALANIGYLYNYGRGVAQDFVQAVQWARRAADAGSETGQRLLGILLYEGREGVRQNQADGLYWLRRAAAQNDDFARDYLNERDLSLQ